MGSNSSYFRFSAVAVVFLLVFFIYAANAATVSISHPANNTGYTDYTPDLNFTYTVDGYCSYYTDDDLEDGLVGHWAFEETLNNTHATDFSSQSNTGTWSGYTNNDGTLQNSPTWTSVNNYSVRGNNALDFDGVDQYVTVTDDSSLNITNEITINAWIKHEPSGTDDYIVDKSNANKGYALSINGNYIRFLLNEDWGGDADFTGNIAIDENWHHVAVTFNGTNMSIWLDGELDGSKLWSGKINKTSNSLYVGTLRTFGANNYFNGTIDEVRIWNKALNQSEIQNEMHSHIPIHGIGLVSSWSFEKGSGSTAYDTNNYIKGEYRGGDRFDGSDDYMDVSDDASLDIRNSITISGWFRSPTGLTEEADQWFGGINKFHSYGFAWQGWSETWTFRLYNSTEDSYDANTDNDFYVPANQWVHVAGTWDGTEMVLYINGTQQGTQSFVGTLRAAGDSFRIGKFSTSYWNGTIDEVQIYNRALDSTEIERLYNSTKDNFIVENDTTNSKSLSFSTSDWHNATVDCHSETVDSTQHIFGTTDSPSLSLITQANNSITKDTNITLSVTYTDANDENGNVSFYYNWTDETDEELEWGYDDSGLPENVSYNYPGRAVDESWGSEAYVLISHTRATGTPWSYAYHYENITIPEYFRGKDNVIFSWKYEMWSENNYDPGYSEARIKLSCQKYSDDTWSNQQTDIVGAGATDEKTLNETLPEDCVNGTKLRIKIGMSVHSDNDMDTAASHYFEGKAIWPTNIGTNTGISNGSTTSENLITTTLRLYEWYATATDGIVTYTGPLWNFLHANMTNCSDVGFTSLRFDMYDETDFSDITNTSSDIDIWFTNVTATGRTGSIDGSLESTADDSHDFCIEPSGYNYVADANLIYGGGNYGDRIYYLASAGLNNTTETILLYMIPDNQTIEVTFTVRDHDLTYMEGVYVDIQRKDLAAGTYRTMTTAQTDSNGKFTAKIASGSEIQYKFIVKDTDGSTVLDTISPVTFSPSTTAYTITVDEKTFKLYDDVSYDCTYVNASTQFVCDVVDSSGLMTESRLVVDRKITHTWNNICDSTETTSSATHVCNIPDTSDEYRYELYVVDDTERVDTGYIDLGITETDTYGLTGVFLTMLIILTIGTIGIFHPAFSAIGGSIAIAVSYVAGLIALSPASVVGMVCVAGIITIRMMMGDRK